MSSKKIRIIGKENKIITLKELFKGKEETRKQMATLPFEEKIKMLVSLQEIAYGWGDKKDIVVWKLI